MNLGHRLIVTYEVSWTGGCGPLGRFNSASAKIASVRINATTGEWLSNSLINQFYSLYHYDNGHQVAFVDDGGRSAEEFDNGNYLVGVQIERGCKPILTVRFMPGMKNKLLLWKKEEAKAEKMQQETTTEKAESEIDKKKAISKQYITFIGITIAIILGVSVILIIFCKCIASKTRERREYFR